MSTQYAVTEPRSVSLQILDLVAELEGVDPVQLRPPLHSSVDPDVLDAIVSETANGDERSADVEFSYLGYRISISISGDPTISVTEDENADRSRASSRERSKPPESP